MFSKAVAGAEEPAPRRGAGGGSPDVPIRDVMWKNVGLVRDADSLRTAIDQLDAAREASPLAAVGWLIAKAALRREESRGGHYRSDFPARDDVHWKFHLSERIQR